MTGLDIHTSIKQHRAAILALAALVVCLLLPRMAGAQDESGYSEVPVSVNVQGVGIMEMPAVIHEQDLYLSVADLFDYLKIKNVPAASLDSITGFFAHPDAVYMIDKLHHRIQYQDKTHDIRPDGLVRTEAGLYLRSDYLSAIFGLDFNFNFRSLSASMTSKVELPWIREMRQEQIRRNISQLKGNKQVDTSIGREFLPLHFGAADWSVVAGQDNGRQDLRLNLGIGMVVAGGETNLGLVYNSNEPVSLKQQYYMWRYVNNDHKLVRQVRLGKIATPSISSIYAPVVGIQVSNSPTTFRKSFGTYTLSNVTKPGWMVELYVNNVLLEYKQAGPSGYYSFEVPLLYGSSVIKLRFYGPWGEEYSREEYITIPFSFVPDKAFEYTASAGVLEDDHYTRYSNLNMNYGVSKRISLGGGVEYLSSVASGTVMPYLSSSVRVASSLMLSGEYVYGVRSKAGLNYRLPRGLQFELNYVRYQPGQKAINNSYLEERKALVSFPLRTRWMSLFSQLKLSDYLLPATRFTTAEWMLSGSLGSVVANLNTFASFYRESLPYVYSNLSLAFRLPGRFMLTPGLQYSFSGQELISAKCMVEKNLKGRGFLNLTYERSFKTAVSSMILGFRFDLSYAQLGISSTVSSDNRVSVMESARGSLLLDRKSRYMDVNNRVSVGKGGMVITPFLDLNANNRRDAGEPKLSGLKFRLNAGRIHENAGDTTIRVFDLEPYTSYYLELDGNSFDNIAWQIRRPHLNIAITPNRVATVDIPVAVVAEIGGRVFVEKEGERKGQGRIIVQVFRSDSSLAARIMTEADGNFYYIGLAPGSYYIRLDASQLNRLHLTAAPAVQPLEIHQSRDGEVVDGLQFILKPVPDGAVKENAGPADDHFKLRPDTKEQK